MKARAIESVEAHPEIYSLVAGEIYEVRELTQQERRLWDPNANLYIVVSTGRQWYKSRFESPYDVPTCEKCGITNPPSDEDCIPCPDGKHEWC